MALSSLPDGVCLILILSVACQQRYDTGWVLHRLCLAFILSETAAQPQGRAGTHLPRNSMMPCTMPGSARVDVSPSSSSFLTAILRRMRLMILPDRVFGSPAKAPMLT